jgi:hypothetical protein
MSDVDIVPRKVRQSKRQQGSGIYGNHRSEAASMIGFQVRCSRPWVPASLRICELVGHSSGLTRQRSFSGKPYNSRLAQTHLISRAGPDTFKVVQLAAPMTREAPYSCGYPRLVVLDPPHDDMIAAVNGPLCRTADRADRPEN